MTASRKQELKSKLLLEACDALTSPMRLKITDLTLLSNACAEAAEWRAQNGMTQGEKYEAMCSRIEKASAELDKRISSWVARKLKQPQTPETASASQSSGIPRL